MKPAKEFDCVEMKREIQENLMKELDALGQAEFDRRARERIAAHPILGKLKARTTANPPAPPKTESQHAA